MRPRKKSWRDHAHKPVYSTFWYQVTRFVLRRAAPVGLMLGVVVLGETLKDR